MERTLDVTTKQTRLIDCPDCGGDGEIPSGSFDAETGYPKTNKCGNCEGDGKVLAEVEICDCCKLPLDDQGTKAPVCKCDKEWCLSCDRCDRHCLCDVPPFDADREDF